MKLYYFASLITAVEPRQTEQREGDGGFCRALPTLHCKLCIFVVSFSPLLRGTQTKYLPLHLPNSISRLLPTHIGTHVLVSSPRECTPDPISDGPDGEESIYDLPTATSSCYASIHAAGTIRTVRPKPRACFWVLGFVQGSSTSVARVCAVCV